jgi:hypothetical protein
MSTEVVIVRELISNLKQTLNDRLAVFEDFLVKSKQAVATGDTSLLEKQVAALEAHFHSLDDYTMSQVRTIVFNHDMLENRVESLENAMKSAMESFNSINTAIGAMQKRMDDEKPVEAAEVEAEIEETQEAALSEAPAEEAEEEAEEEEEDEGEEEESPYEFIFTFKGVDYYQDKESHNVYNPDEDGGVDPEAIVGLWNPNTEKMWDHAKQKWWDYKTNTYVAPKTKKTA